jgi:hypothetical protein
VAVEGGSHHTAMRMRVFVYVYVCIHRIIVMEEHPLSLNFQGASLY